MNQNTNQMRRQNVSTLVPKQFKCPSSNIVRCNAIIVPALGCRKNNNISIYCILSRMHPISGSSSVKNRVDVHWVGKSQSAFLIVGILSGISLSRFCWSTSRRFQCYRCQTFYLLYVPLFYSDLAIIIQVQSNLYFNIMDVIWIGFGETLIKQRIIS